jgi:DNA ligase-1
MIEALYKTIEELRSTSSQLKKREILARNYEPILPILRMVYDPFKQFYLTHQTAMERGNFTLSNQKDSLLEILQAFSTRKVSGQKAYDIWKIFILSQPEQYQEILGKVLDKDLECRVDLKILNSVLRECGEREIPFYEVALGELWKGEPIWEEKTTWYASRKFDGVRCSIFLKEGEEPLALSRTGKRFETLEPLLQFFRGYTGPSIMLDGELALWNKNGEDDFKGLMSQIRRKDHQIENITFHLFDAVKEGYPALFSKRLAFMKGMVKNWKMESRVRVVRQIPVKDEDHFLRLLRGAQSRGWEGLMLRKNVPYKEGRSRDLLKVKEMQELEAEVIGIETGKMRVIREGKEIEIDVMTKAIIEYKGNKVGIGSGWCEWDRRQFFVRPQDIVGKIATIEYFEETRNKNGSYSLRFPVVKTVHGAKREV